MVKIDSEKNGKNVLLMLSGGRDSFLSACRLVDMGYSVKLITYNNGCMSCTENVAALVERVVNLFGEDRVSSAGIHMIAQNIKPLLRPVLYKDPIVWCRDYPHLTLHQLICLACHTAMYAHSIAYCKAFGISYIAEGARKQQRFFVELPEMAEAYKKLCHEHEVELLLPVYDLASDTARKDELAEWGFLPKTYEPQCWAGCPMEEDLTLEQRDCLFKYYKEQIRPQLDSMIDRLCRKKICLGPEGSGCNAYM